MGQRINLIRRLSADLLDFLRSLTPQDRHRPSPCDLWEVDDVVAHLVGGAERQMGSMLRGRDGDAGPPSGFVATDAATLSAGNAQRDLDIRRRLGDGLLTVFQENYDRLWQVLSDFDPDGWESPCWHARRGTMTARDYLDLRIQELVVHDWDIRSTFDPASRLDPEGVVALVPVVPTWLGMCFRPGGHLSKPITYRFQLTDNSGQTMGLTCWGDRFDTVNTATGKADFSIACDGETYLLYVYGRLDAERGASSGRLTVEGNVALLRNFKEWFKGL